jgi:predicted Fe-Mo cluster-binding NifX family protein
LGRKPRRRNDVKIAVTAQGQTLESPVDPRFGRAKYFIVVETDSGDFEVVDNEQNLNAQQGAGIQAARTVAEKGAETVITGHCGPNAFRTLSAGGIKVVVGAEGTVTESLEKFKTGDLQAADDADVQGHWG